LNPLKGNPVDLNTLNINELIELQTEVRGMLKNRHKWYDTTRPSWDVYFSLMTQVVSTRGCCCRRRVGAVLVDQDHNTLATGYNGKAAGLINCLDCPCAGAYASTGEGLGGCEAIHAEINALIRCADVKQIHTAYVTCSPCVDCVNILLGTGCKRIVFTEEYKHNEESKRRWESSGREWVYLQHPSVVSGA
jgi:dCMP deaminase